VKVELEGYIGRKFDTKFLRGDFEFKELDEEIIKYCRVLSRKGLTPNKTGNVSVRFENGMLITAGGTDLGKLNSGDIVYVLNFDFNDNTTFVIGSKEPSSETPMHWMIYNRYDDVNAVVHVHDPLVKEENLQKFGIKCTEREFPYGTIELAEEVVDALRESRYVVMKNHGSVSVGSNLREAVEFILDIHRRIKNESKDSWQGKKF